MIEMKHPFPAQQTRVIRLKGSDHEIGRQHAMALKDCVQLGMPSFYFRMWSHLSSGLDLSRREKILRAPVKWWIDRVPMARLRRSVPQSYLDRIEGMTAVTGQDMSVLLSALVLPDLMPILQGLLAKIRPSSVMRVQTPTFGCSSFISQGANFLHGRNLDFPGVGYWDRYPVIQVTERPGRLKYIGFTTAGVPFCGISGINEAQISISLHQHYCTEYCLNGQLPFVLAEEVLGSATSLAAAIEILSKAEVASAWAFVITDGKRRQGAILERHPNGTGIRKLSDGERVLAHSNYFQTPECQPSEYAATARMNWDNTSRKKRLQSLIASHGWELTEEQAVAAICDHYDPYWNEEKILNRTVSQTYNIQSYVLDPVNMKVYVAEGNAPIHLRNYQQWDLGAIFSGQGEERGKTIPGFRFTKPEMGQAKEAFILSFIAAFDADFQTARKELKRSLNTFFSAEVAIPFAILSMKFGEYAEAASNMERAAAEIEGKMKERNLGQHPPEYFEILIYLARAQDLMGNRNSALGTYRRMLACGDIEDARIHQLAREGKRYRHRDLTKIITPYSSYIPFQ